MTLSPATRLGTYEIVAPLGAGGMGEVYRARDTRLNRDVAVKVLPHLFALDPERLARFTREAQTLASLNHPNIAQIYAVVDAPCDGATVSAIVMEFVDGESLAARLTGGRIPLREALAIARQIADALTAAHDAGIIHRDLKPANIMQRADGTVKVLDFGLAKILNPTASGSGAAAMPVDGSTLTSPALTRAGVIMGTAAYLSPEQARGMAIDKRTDVWAFGCVLYEMLSGRRAFDGATVSDAIAKILEREPDWSAIPAGTPPPVTHVLRRMLAKDPRQRLRDAGDAAIEWDDDAAMASVPSRRASPGWWPLAIVSSLLLVAAAVAVREHFVRAPQATAEWTHRPVVFEIDPPYSAPQLAISADGETIIWPATGSDGRRRLLTRSLSGGEARELRGTENATFPFLAPDGRAAGFFIGGELRRIDLASGVIQTLAATPGVSLGGAWSTADVIVFSNRYGLQAMAAGGGSFREVASLDRSRQENSLRFPSFLPDARHFLYVARSGRPAQNAAYLGSLDGPPKLLFPTTSVLQFVQPGYLIYLRGGTLVAREFDVATASVSGDELPIVHGVGANPLGLGGAFAASSNGVLLYGRAGPATVTALRWFDRQGRDLGGFTDPGVSPQFRIAPDGHRVAVTIVDEQAASRSVWIYDPPQTRVRLTLPGTHDWEPIWSNDGSRVAFASYRDGPLNLYVKAANGASTETPLLLSSDQKDPCDWSPDGRYLLYRDSLRDIRGDLVAIDVRNREQRVDVARTDAPERSGRFSPDGRWVAYVSEETGRAEVWVQPFPPTGAKWQISLAGGDEPAWSREGRELLYMDAQGVIVGGAVSAQDGSFVVGPPQPILKTVGALASSGAQRYDVTRDGSRFLVAVPSPGGPPARPRVIVNWSALLRRR